VLCFETARAYFNLSDDLNITSGMICMLSSPNQLPAFLPLEQKEFSAMNVDASDMLSETNSDPCSASLDDMETHAVITPNEPYKFIFVSDHICEFLDYAREQMSGRSIKMLHGPCTHSARLAAAIKLASLHHCSTLPLTVYSRDGVGRNTLVSCGAHLSADGEVDGVTLKFLRTCEPAHNPSVADFKADVDQCHDIDADAAAGHRDEDETATRENKRIAPFSRRRCVRESSRAEHNRMVGWELKAE
jgi:hypothetical protein